MKAVQLSVIYLSIFISIYWNYVQTTKRGSVKGTKKDQFTITGNGTTKGGKMKIFVHVQTTGKNPNKAVPGKKQGKEAPNVKLGQSGETPSPSPTTTPPMSTQVTSTSPKPKKGKHFQVTPKPPISGKIQSLKPSQSKKLAPSQSMKKHSEIKSVSSSVNNAASSTVDSAKVTPTPSANLKSSLTTSTGVLPSPNSAMSTPSPQSSGAVPVQSKQAATSGSPGSSSQPTNKQTKTSRSSASSPLPDKSSSQVSVQPSATKSVAIQSSSMSTLAPSLSVPSAVISSTPLSITPSASKTVVNPASSPASLGPSSTLPPPVKSPGAGTSSAAVTQTSSLLGSSPFSSPGSTISPSKSSLTNTVATKNPTTSPDFTFSRDEHIALDEHNFFRNLHKSVPLSLNKDMVLEARKFAKKISVTGNLTHESPDKLKQIGQGENLGLVCSKVELSAARVVRKVIDTWHREACKYNFQEPDPMSKKAAHFTQLVWGASKQLGVGVAAAKNAEKNCIYVVARYKPMEALKTKEQLKTNVKKGLFDASIDCAATSKKKFFIAV